ncbi:uncharacterized protein LOC131625553 [Vicia villosa]|uniref:uncharacterized protein LOC131625553 n=1 Tax=Vicia villosa TaxID=3911 RepID=UPI00273C149C|nr:uncharacterized protein LOC131625553 [Vicia villosa]
MDPSKVDAVLQWETPKLVMEIRSFLGLAGYYRRFIEGFSKLALSLMQLTCKGGVLMQNDKVVAYTSRQLRIHERNYPTHDLDLAAGIRVQNLEALSLWWLELLKDYDFGLNYHPGKPNVVTDALSQKTLHMSMMMVKEFELIEQFRDLSLVCERTLKSVMLGMLKINSDFLTRIKEAQKLDVKLVDMMAEIYIRVIVKLHGVPSSIVSDRDMNFTSEFWKIFHDTLGSKLKFNYAYHPQKNGQTDRTIQSLEDLFESLCS